MDKAHVCVNSFYNSVTYILPVCDCSDCWLVDCGDVGKVVEQGWHVCGVLLTHVHFDHIYGLNRLMELFPEAFVYTNEAGRDGLMNPKWNFSKYHVEVENFVFCSPEKIRVIECEGLLNVDEGLSVEALFTPGHEPSCISYRWGDVLFTGDSYIPGVKVVANFPRSDKQLAMDSQARLQKLERSGLKIMPGHYVKNE